jgi:hypothetical protein
VCRLISWLSPCACFTREDTPRSADRDEYGMPLDHHRVASAIPWRTASPKMYSRDVCAGHCGQAKRYGRKLPCPEGFARQAAFRFVRSTARVGEFDAQPATLTGPVSGPSAAATSLCHLCSRPFSGCAAQPKRD